MSENIITIDGREFTFSPGETILVVAKRNGIFIPTLCHLKGAAPTGACRICVVEIEGGRGLSPACAMPAADKMVVRTGSPAVNEARRTILAMLLLSGNHNCAIAGGDAGQWSRFQKQVESYDQTTELCPAHGECKLQAHAYRYQVDTSAFIRMKTEYPMEMASPLIVRDFSRCILCGRCVDACNVIQVNNAINHGFRGAKAKIIAMGDGAMERSDCVFCGQCIQSCPVAALVEKKSRYKIRPWEARHVRTTCHYCGIGCQMNLHVKDDTIMKVTAVEEALPNLGRLCVKGRFGYDFVKSPERLTHPMIRENGKLRDASWDEALDLVASRIRETMENEGPEAVAGVCSAKCTNEALYLMQKLFRSAIGSNNVASPYAANGWNNPIGELEKAKRIVLIGCDVTEENPVAGTFIKRASKTGCQLAVIDSRPTKIGEFADLHLLVKKGTESVLVNGIIHELLERGRKGSDEISEIAASFSMDPVTETTGLSSGDVKALADMLETEDPAMVVYGSRVASFSRTFAYLQELLGNLGKECGGVNFLGELNNSHGACDMGLLPEYLPGYKKVDDEEARNPFEEAWACTLNSEPGADLTDMVSRMNGPGGNPETKIHLLFCAGEDLVVADTVIPGMKKALESVRFLVVQDILKNEMLEYADVVLPASAWAEHEGTYTNCERRVNRVRQAVPSPGEARPDTWIFTHLANRLGQNWPESTPREIWEKEIATLIPKMRGITYNRIETGGIQWPVPDTTSPGTEHLKGDRPPLLRGEQVSFNYQHRALLEQCEGLIESLPRSGGIGTQVPPSDPEEVTEKFIQLLEEEEKTDAKARIDEILETYRSRRGGLIPVLQQIQEILGFLPVPVQNYIARGLGIPASDVFGVVTFYSFFTMVPRGKHIVRVCLGTACFVKGSKKLLDNLERHLDISIGETTGDREFSLDLVRCIGACGLAPVMVVDDVTHGEVDPKEVINIIESCREEP